MRIGARDATSVVVDAEEVDRLADQREVVRRPVWPCFAEDLAHLLGIATAEYGVEVLAGHLNIRPRGRRAGGRVRGRGGPGGRGPHAARAGGAPGPATP